MKTQQRGYILILALTFFAIFFAVSVAFQSYLTVALRAERIAVARLQAQSLAEGGIDAAVYALNQDDLYTGESDTSVGEGAISVEITSLDETTRLVHVIANIPAIEPVASSTVTARLSKTTAWNFVPGSYGVRP